MKVTVPLLFVKVLLLLKLPFKVKVLDVAVRIPALMVSPFKVIALLPKLSVPVPDLVRLYVPCEIIPPMVKAPVVVVILRFPFIVTMPIPRFKAFVPAKVKSPFKASGLLLLSVIVPPLVLLIVALPPMVNVPETVPSAVTLLMFKVPEFNVVPP